MTAADEVQPPEKPAGRHARCIVVFATITVVFLAFDLASKYLAFAYVADKPIVIEELASLHELPDHDAIVVIPHFLALKLTLNTGAVFGLGKGMRWFFLLIGSAAIYFITRLFALSPKGAWWLHVPLALILAGALGNLYDRFLYGAVRDLCWLFPNVKLPFGLEWPWLAGRPGADELYPWIFNIADVALVIGVLWLLPIFLFSSKKDAKDAPFS